MKSTVGKVLAASVLMALAGLSVARPDLNSFLNKPANTTDKLINQIRNDPQVADRYVRHFAMSKTDVIAYLSFLRPGRTPNDGVFMIYSVPDNGTLKARVDKVAKGTPVFADASGKPTLIMKCGNPMTRGPRNPESINENAVDTVEEERIALREIASETPVAVDMVALNNPIEPGAPVLAESPPPVVTGGSPTRIVTGGPGGGLNLGPLGLGIALIGAGLGSLGGGGSTVPEPSTMVVFGVCALVLVARKRVRKSLKV